MTSDVYGPSFGGGGDEGVELEDAEDDAAALDEDVGGEDEGLEVGEPDEEDGDVTPGFE